MTSGRCRRCWGAWGSLLYLGIAFVTMNVSLLPVAVYANAPFTPAGLWVCICMGEIRGQAALLAIFAVLGPGNILVRHLLVMPAASALMVGWLWGAYIGDWIRGNNYQPTP